MPNNEYDYDNLSLDIFKGKYTLVIGDDVILRKEQEYCSGNVRDYMRKRIGNLIEWAVVTMEASVIWAFDESGLMQKIYL